MSSVTTIGRHCEICSAYVGVLPETGLLPMERLCVVDGGRMLAWYHRELRVRFDVPQHDHVNAYIVYEAARHFAAGTEPQPNSLPSYETSRDAIFRIASEAL